jgi:ATPase subunit of ABC transporter with duplicated ATPase domains
MHALVTKGLAFAYGDAAPLFEHVDLHLTPGWYGLVGPNGSGKTTLLRLLAGALRSDAGHVRFEPPDAVVVACAQDVHEATDAVRALADAADGAARRLRATLRLDSAEIDRWPSLSPGERKRWQIGGALAADPDVLLLDEPTNHLDAQARDWLTRALAAFRGIGIVVSHDRTFLEALARDTIRVHGASVTLTPGAYDDAKRQWDLETSRAHDERSALRAARDAAERKLADARRTRASAQRSLSSTHKDPRDHDARGMLRKGRAESAERSLARVVTSRRSSLEQASDRLAAAQPTPRELGGALFVDWEPAPRARILSAHLPELRGGERVLLRDVALDVARDARVRIAGANGAGKTTLLRALVAGHDDPRGRILYLPQDTSPADDRAALDALRALDPATRGRALSFVAALGVSPDRLLASRQPSPGEARKLRIAIGLGRSVWALVLDEPTNHLDLPSIERLERALDAYPGALVLVSHDEAFVRACRCETWLIESERVSFV